MTTGKKILVGISVFALVVGVCGVGYTVSNNVLLPAVAKAAVSTATPSDYAELNTKVDQLAAAIEKLGKEPTVTEKEVLVEKEVPVGVAGITTETLAEYVEDTRDVGALIAVLDRTWESGYDKGHRGEWSAGNTTVEHQAVGWLDTRTGKPPEGSAGTIRRQGGWGVYVFPAGFSTPPGTAGRWISVTGDLSALITEGAPRVEAKTTGASTGTGASTKAATTEGCIPGIKVGEITEAADPVTAYNEYFEATGYQYGASLDPGQEIPAGSFFLGTLVADAIPEGFTNLSTTKPGFLWGNSQSATAPNGGRWMKACRQ